MFNTTPEGYIIPTGDNSGGHAYLLIGVDTQKENPDGTKRCGKNGKFLGRFLGPKR